MFESSKVLTEVPGKCVEVWFTPGLHTLGPESVPFSVGACLNLYFPAVCASVLRPLDVVRDTRGTRNVAGHAPTNHPFGTSNLLVLLPLVTSCGTFLWYLPGYLPVVTSL